MNRNLILVFLFSFGVTLSALPKTTQEWQKAILADAKTKSYKEALAKLEEWKAQKGETDPQYWVVSSNVWFAMGTESKIAITGRPKDGSEPKAPEGKSFELQDPKTGKVMGHISEGEPSLDKEKVRKAIGCLDQALQLAPHRVDIYTGRAHLYRSMGDLAGELKALESLATDPRALKGKYERGPGMPLDEPLEDYQVDMLNNYAREHFQKDTPADDKACGEVAKLIVRLFPKKAQGYNLLGALAGAKGEWKEGVEWFSKALTAVPEDSMVWFNKGYAQEKLGDLSGAKKCYQKVVALDNDAEWVKKAKESLENLK